MSNSLADRHLWFDASIIIDCRMWWGFRGIQLIFHLWSFVAIIFARRCSFETWFSHGQSKIVFQDMNKLWHTVRNLHFLSKNSTLIYRENCWFLGGWKTRENVLVWDFLAVDNFDFTRKIAKKKLGEKLVKMLRFQTF